jgi:thiamine pyrophosphate-dependent acetolactate synthase large subunit-like protein
MEELQQSVRMARAHEGPAVIEVLIDPTEYTAHARA